MTGRPDNPPAPAGHPVLQLRSVSHGFVQGGARIDILNAANLDLFAGRAVALVGPSGAGKSTLLHICGLLERPGDGEVIIAGQQCRQLSDAGRTAIRRHNIGFVYQMHHLMPEFSALENIMIPQMIAGLPRHVARHRAGELLNFMRLGARMDHRPAEMSGGECQRVAICRALANAPKILLADEPSGNLDPLTAAHVFDSLMNIVRQSAIAALVATHNLELARRLDAVVTIRDGHVHMLDDRRSI